MVEVQYHGFSFEKWVRDSFFDGYEGNYMQKWDIPAEKNIQKIIPVGYRGIPISVKTANMVLRLVLVMFVDKGVLTFHS